MARLSPFAADRDRFNRIALRYREEAARRASESPLLRLDIRRGRSRVLHLLNAELVRRRAGAPTKGPATGSRSLRLL